MAGGGRLNVAEFRLLGPVDVVAAGRLVDAGQPRQRGVLAALLVDVGRAVSVETLMDRVWGDLPPDGARHALHTYFARIRRMLAEIGQPDALVRRFGGYLLEVDPDEVDYHRFRTLIEQARDPRREDADRVVLLRTALDLWRGEPLTGLYGPWPDRIRDVVRGLRVDAAVLWAGAALRTGNAGAVIGPTEDLAGENPLSEPVAAVLMRALHAAGRTAEALDHYTAVRKRLVEELGTEPGTELQRVHQSILRGEAATPGPASGAPAGTAAVGVAPAQLPLGVPAFAGRAAELARLDAILAAADEHRGPVVISALSGTAGVGKTALAVTWAHRVSGQFPDGQLYVNLRGFDPGGAAMTAADAVRGFLDALGVAAQRMPAGLDAQVGLYRSLLAGRRVLVVLDNARDAEQIRPLLPGSATALVLVTSRHQLGGLVAAEGAHPIALGLLSTVEARELLARRIGEERVAAEPEAVDEIVVACARLPLALAIVAARAATHPRFPLRALADELRVARAGLDAFASDDSATDVRGVFSSSYHALSPAAARLFRLCGLHPGPELAVPAAASLAGSSLTLTRPLLAELTRANLLTEPAPGRYTVHDLLRAYATELTDAHDSEIDRRAARHRLLDHYLHTGRAGARLLDPQRDPIALASPLAGAVIEELPDTDAAMAWFAAEHVTLLAAVRQAAEHGFETHTWQLAWVMADFLDRRGHWQDWVSTQRAAVAAAERLGDRSGQGHAHRVLGRAYARLGRNDDAEVHVRRALELYGGLGDRVNEARSLFDLGWVNELRGNRGEALRFVERALDLYRLAGHRGGEVQARNALAWLRIQSGDYAGAIADCREAITLLADAGDRRNEAATWDTLASAHHHLGAYREAAGCYRRSVALFQAIGDRYYGAETLAHLGDTLDAAGDRDAAREAWRSALTVFTDLGHPDADQIRRKLG